MNNRTLPFYRRMLWLLGLVLSTSITYAQFTQLGSDLPGTQPGDRFGYSLQLADYGNILVALREGTSAQAYRWDGVGCSWVTRGAAIAGDYYDASLSADGNILALGTDSIQIYQWNGANYVSMGSPIRPVTVDEAFGTTLRLSADGQTIAFSLYNANLATNFVRILRWNGTSWAPFGADIPTLSTVNEVDLSGDGKRVVIGEPSAGIGGIASVYEYTGPGWIPVGITILGIAADELGYSVSMTTDGQHIAIGLPGNLANNGAVQVFSWNGVIWVPVLPTLLTAAASDRFGSSVDISANALRVAGGGPSSNKGHARIFDYDGVTWNLSSMNIQGDNNGDEAGTQVSLSASGGRLAIGYPGHDQDFIANPNDDRGLIRVFSADDILVDFPTSQVISCTVDAAHYPAPTASNINVCPASISLMGPPVVTDYDPCVDTLRTITREWAVMYSNNMTVFRDTLTVFKMDINDVVFPEDTMVSCSNLPYDTTITAAGRPTIDGVPLVNNTGCNLWVFLVQTVDPPKCPGEFVIRRTWTVKDDCDVNAMETMGQIVTVKDTTPPEMVLVSPVYASTSTQDCQASLQLPVPERLSDGCTDSLTLLAGLQITWQSGPVTQTVTPVVGVDRRVSGLMVGTHIFRYQVWDGCGTRGNADNTTYATMEVIVEDNTPPVAMCLNKDVQLTNNLAEIYFNASQFDGGSFDHCATQLYFKVRRMDVNPACETPGNPDNWWYDNIRFCCADEGTTVMVLLGAFQYDPGTGPIDPADDRANLVGTCMAMVTVTDKSAPVIDCPIPTTVDCRPDLDLGLTATPDVTDNCSVPRILLNQIDRSGLNACGVGTAILTWVATDDAGNSAICPQVITIENNDPFDANNPDHLVWPADTTLWGCGVASDTSVTGRPDFLYDGCAQLAFKYYDDVYDNVAGACKKILRIWRILDWCQFSGSEYDPFQPNNQGVWQHIQVIKIMDSVAPVWASTIQDVTVNIDQGCGPIHARLDPFEATDCNSNLKYRFRVDYGNNLTIDTSGLGNVPEGTFPEGVSKVHIYADDGCGNVIDTFYLVTARDNKPPTPELESLITTLMGPNGMIDVAARKFNKSSRDNCTPDDELLFSYTDRIEDSVRIFTCADLGMQLVTIYVFDGAGNFDFAVNVPLTIQDPSHLCPGPAPSGNQGEISVLGKIATSVGKAVDQTDVFMRDEASAEIPVSTNVLGQYVFNKVPVNHTYEIRPEKNINPLNGVSTLDVVKIMKHILGVDKLNSPYQLLAADVNFSGQVNGADVIDLRKIVLGMNDFKDERSWIFIDQNYQFENPADPLSEDFPQTYTIRQADEDMQINFIGVKMGDVDNTAIVGQLAEAEIRSNPIIPVYYNAPFLQEGKDYQIEFTADALPEVWGGQFALKLDPEVAVIESMVPGRVLKLGSTNDRQIQDGLFKYSFVQMEPMDVSQGEVLFTLTIRARKSTSLDGHVQFVSDELQPEVYHQQETKGLALIPGQPGTEGMRLAQNRPNPFADQTIIDYFLPQSSAVQFTVIDMAGRQVLARQLVGQKGLNSVVIHGEELPKQGMYIYLIRTDEGLLQNKMIYLR